MKLSTKTLVAAGLVLSTGVVSNTAQAQQQVIGFDDYNTAAIGVDYVSRTFSPDNANANGGQNAGVGGQTGFGGGPSPTFGNNFDLWGVAQRSASGASGEPFDVFDDSTSGFAADVMGYNSIGTDGFVVASDTLNDSNSSSTGNVRVDYVFNITGYENLQVNIDWGAWGRFEAADSFTVSAGINGGTQSTIMEVGMTAAQEQAETLYTLTMADGDIADIYFNPFFDDDDQEFLEANLESIRTGGAAFNPATGNLVNFHEDDADQDGRIDSPTATRPDNTTAAHNSNGGNDQELETYARPLYATTDGFATVTQLNNILETIIADVEGTGDTLELSISGVTDGSIEYIIFDNIEITGTLIGGGDMLPGDANGDGMVSLADLDILGQNFGGSGDFSQGDFNGDGQISLADLDILGQNFGTSSDDVASVAAVPEPTSLALLGLGGLLVARRRRG